jgi:transcriptional regulator with XRE-family HTH domain
VTASKEKSFGELMRFHLKKKGWSNAELARRTGFSPTHIGNLIQDRSPGAKSGKPKRLTADTVDKIARALDMPLEQARRAAGLASPSADASKSESSAELPSNLEDLLLYYFRRMPSEQKPEVLALVAAYYRQSQMSPEQAQAFIAQRARAIAELGLQEGEELEFLPSGIG